MDDGPDVSALATVWAETLEREGLSSRVHVALWLDEHREPPPKEDADALVRRMTSRARLVDLAAERSVAHSHMQDVLHRTALLLLIPHLDDVAAWHQARLTGVSDQTIAELSGTLPEVISLALDGWPTGRTVIDETRVVKAHECWRAGGSRADIAAVLGIPAAELIRQLNTGESELLPRRLTTADLRERFGWSSSAISIYRRKGVLPTADGLDGVRDWWWEATIDDWEQESELHWCDRCHHAFISPVGLREHRTRMHD